MGAVPDWLPLLVAAEELHCAPWELLEQSIFWQRVAHIKRSASIQAQEIKNPPHTR